MSRIISFVGESNSGKTSVNEYIISQATKSDKSIAVIKSAKAGFNLDIEGKDSYKYKKAGSESVAVTSDSESVIFHKKPLNLRSFITNSLSKTDFIILEGFKTEKHFDKILFVKDRDSIKTKYPDEIKAVYCKDTSGSMLNDFKQIGITLPIFTKGTLKGLWNWMLELDEDKPSLYVNDEVIMMNRFVSNVLRGTFMNFVNQLRVNRDIKTIDIKWEKNTIEKNPILLVNGGNVPMNEFVKSILKSLVFGIIEPLKLPSTEVQKIEIRCF
jgi:molybdopterin-guanine dinucleotide biosynthesis adapter protein